jgi:hypothetical protein
MESRMKNNLFAKLSWLLDKRIFRKRHCDKATKCSLERPTTYRQQRRVGWHYRPEASGN